MLIEMIEEGQLRQQTLLIHSVHFQAMQYQEHNTSYMVVDT
jgi:hypothetical protein